VKLKLTIIGLLVAIGVALVPTAATAAPKPEPVAPVVGASPQAKAGVNFPNPATDYANWIYGVCNWDSALKTNTGNGVAYAAVRYQGNCGNPGNMICVLALIHDTLLGTWTWGSWTCEPTGQIYVGEVIASFVPYDQNQYRYNVVGRMIKFIAPSGTYRCVVDNIFTGLEYYDPC
jgi:hypothetical protein